MATFRHINSYHCIINEKNFCRFLQVGECISPYLQYFIKSNAELFFQFSHIFQDFTTVTFCRNPKRKNGKTNVQKKTLMKRGKALNFLFFIKKHRPVGDLFDEELHHSYTFSEMKPFQKFFNLFYVVNSLGYLCKNTSDNPPFRSYYASPCVQLSENIHMYMYDMCGAINHQKSVSLDWKYLLSTLDY